MPTGTDRLPWEQVADLAAIAADARRRAELYAADPARAGDAAHARREAAEAEADRQLAEDYLACLGASLIDHATRVADRGGWVGTYLDPAAVLRLDDLLGVRELREWEAEDRRRIEALAADVRALGQMVRDMGREISRRDARIKELEEGMSLWEESGLTPSELRSGATGTSGPAAGTAAAARSTGPAASAGPATTPRASRSCTLRFPGTRAAASGT